MRTRRASAASGRAPSGMSGRACVDRAMMGGVASNQTEALAVTRLGLLLLSGPPCSGKSTVGTLLAADRDLAGPEKSAH